MAKLVAVLGMFAVLMLGAACGSSINEANSTTTGSSTTTSKPVSVPTQDCKTFLTDGFDTAGSNGGGYMYTVQEHCISPEDVSATVRGYWTTHNDGTVSPSSIEKEVSALVRLWETFCKDNYPHTPNCENSASK